MAPHSSTLGWRIPGTEEPGRRLSMGSHRVRHDWSDLVAAAAAVVQQSDWVIHAHVSTLFKIIFPFRSLHNIEQSSMCWTIVGPSPTMKSTSWETLQHQFSSTSTLKGDMMKAWSITSSQSGGITVGKGPRNNTFPHLKSEIEARVGHDWATELNWSLLSFWVSL